MSIIDSLKEADSPQPRTIVPTRVIRAVILALEDSHRVLAESGQLEVKVPASLVRIFADENYN